MKNIRSIALGLMLALTAAFSMVGAQTTKPADQPKKTESCCSMSACCCKGDSCSMSNHAKHESKQDPSKEGCCCCNGDSCNIKNKPKQG